MSSTPVGILLLVQLVLILINAFFAAAEIAVVSLNENKVRYQAESGDKKAKRILNMILEPSGFLSTIQVAITLAGFLGSAFAADNFSDMLVDLIVNKWHFTAISASTLNTLCVVLITLILSYVTLVFGELVPKRIAMRDPDKVARFVSGTVLMVSRITRPVIFLLTHSVNLVLRILHIDPNTEEDKVTEDEIRMMVDIGGEKGAIEGNERDMIENVFEFNNMSAADCMIHRTDVTALPVDAPKEEILKTIEESGLSRFPVYGEDLDDVKGTVTARDYLMSLSRGNGKTLNDLLRPAYFVPETVPTDELFRDMQKRKTHLAIVVDEYGGMSGIITMEDLLEEIVGNIYDEYDPQTPQDIQKLSDTTYRVSGTADLEALGKELKVKFPEDEDYDTLGGLIFSYLSSIPKDGAHPEVDCFGLHIRVEELSEHRVEWATVTKVAPEQPSQPPEEKA